MTVEQTEQTFIGTTPFDEWKATRKGFVFIQRHSEPLRVYLADGSVHAYVSQWSYSDDEVSTEGTRIRSQKSNGGHQYVVAASGALHIVENDSTDHTNMQLGGGTEIITNERVATTYAPGAWVRVSGPWMKDLPEKDSQTHENIPGSGRAADVS